MPKFVFGIVGEIKSGKGLASDRLVAAFDSEYTRFSAPLSKAVARLSLPNSRENLQDLSTIVRQGPQEVPPDGELARWLRDGLASPGQRAFRELLNGTIFDIFDVPTPFAGRDAADVLLAQGFGEDLLARTIAWDCKRATKDYMTVDGVRRFADISMLSKMPEFRLIYVTAPFELRYQRTVAQAEKVGEGKMTREEFQRRCEAETEREIPAVGATAHLRIDNVGAKEDVYRALDAYLLELEPVAYG